MPAYDLATPAGRFRAYWDYWWGDHAFLRLKFSNKHWVGDQLLRANQPWPHQIKAYADLGVKTIINLRGGFDASFYALEKDACARFGVALEDFTITSREAPSKARVLGAKQMFERIQYPAMLHCKSGADRAGIMSVFYRHFHLGEPIETAREALSLKYLHIQAGKTGILDYVFERYLTDAAPKGVSFLDWTQSDAYDPEQIKRDFKPTWLGGLLTEKILRRE